MVCPACKIMAQRLRRANQLEHVCRYPKCKHFGHVVAREEIAEPVIEESEVTEGGETTDE